MSGADPNEHASRMTRYRHRLREAEQGGSSDDSGGSSPRELPDPSPKRRCTDPAENSDNTDEEDEDEIEEEEDEIEEEEDEIEEGEDEIEAEEDEEMINAENAANLPPEMEPLVENAGNPLPEFQLNLPDDHEVLFDVDDDEADSDNEQISTDEEYEIEEDEEDVPELPEHDPPLYTGAPITVSQSLLAILTFVIVHRCTGVALADLLGLIAMHCIATDNLCRKTVHSFKKYFLNIKSPLNIHHFCSNCFATLQSKDDVCEQEECVDAGGGISYFIEISIISQLRAMFKREGFWDLLNFRFHRVKQHANNYEDVYDGRIYRTKMDDGFLANRQNISFLWNTDGVSIFKSAKISIWPFYLAINELSYSKRFKKENVVVAGLWFGPSKPALPLFLNSFHSDLRDLHEGIDVDLPGHNRVRVRGAVLCGTCDMPAKSHFLNIMQYNGYYGCPKCRARGERSERTNMNHAYPYGDEPLRSDQETVGFAQLAEDRNTPIYGIKGFSALSMFVPNYITSTSVDVMHCVSQGVIKTLTKFWFDEDFFDCPFFLHAVTEAVSAILVKLTPPTFVKRMPRSISEHLSYWKASEFKAWLFYYSIPLLAQIMTPEYFNHHLLLVHGIYLLNQSSISDAMVDEAEACLNEYVIKFQDLYGFRYLTINFHMLTHLAENVRNLGPLWATSCMPFEDLNGQLKRLVHGTTHAALQITSCLSQVVNLPIMLSRLDPHDNVRVWCENLLKKQKLMVKEQVNVNLSTLGKYVHCQNLPQLIHDTLQDSGILFGNVVQFFKLKKGKLIFSCESYNRSFKTSSSATRFTINNVNPYGLIHTFVRVSDCNCNFVCRCEAQFYAIVNHLIVQQPFAIRYPMIPINYILQCNRSCRYSAVNVLNLDLLLVSLNVNNSLYVINPVNTLEDE